jgi:methyl-accepting chemotaxis protein
MNINMDLKFNIGVKLAAGFIFANLLIMALSVIPYLSIDKITAYTTRIEAAATERNAAVQAVSDLREVEANANDYLLTGDRASLDSYSNSARRAADHFAEARSRIVDSKARPLFDKFEALAGNRLAKIAEKVDGRGKTGNSGAALATPTREYINAQNEILRISSGIDKAENDAGAGYLLLQRNLASSTKTMIILSCLICSVLFTVVSLTLTYHIARPLRDITAMAERISMGDVSIAPTKYSRSDEVGMLARAFERMTTYFEDMSGIAGQIASNNLAVKVQPRSEKDQLGHAFQTMVENLRRMVSDLSGAVNIMAASSNEILALTSQLAASSSETATAVAETTATIAEVKQTVRIVNQKANYVSDTAQNAASVSLNGRASVDESITRMNQIREQMESIAGSIAKLSEQSQTIGSIISSVNDIANQSNLLAVNASIEAAKAGEQGKGFAVVAQEVRNLAEQSKDSTAQVRGILNDIQKAIGGAVMATEQGTKAVETGMIQSNQAGDSIRTMSEAVSDSALATTQIVASTNEQIVGIDQVALAMENIKRASEQIASSIKQAESSSMNLNELGMRLQQVIERFHV